MDKSRRDVLQMVLAEVHIAGQDFRAAYEALKPVCYRWPGSSRVWNTYCRSAASFMHILFTTDFCIMKATSKLHV